MNLNEAKLIYNEAFGEEDVSFERKLFDLCGEYVYTEDTASMLFLLPCDIVTSKETAEGFYLFAAATSKEHRGKGHMSKLIERVKKTNKPIFLKPANDGLIKFYKDLGFKEFKAQTRENEVKAIPKYGFSELAQYEKEEKEFFYTAMCVNISPEKLNGLYFPYIME